MSITDPLATPDRFAVLGDTHGDWGFTVRALEYAQQRCADVVVQVGDFGFRRRDDPFLAGVSAVACKLDLPVLWIDGNHENHPALLALPLDPATGLRPVAPGVWHLPRGFRWSWGDLRLLALGGAHSIDRARLFPGLDWFPEERITTADLNRALDGGPVDVLFTHDAPAGVDIPGLEPHRWPPADLRSSEHHRELVRLVVDQTRPRWLFHGHFHVPYVATLAGGDYCCTVRGLSWNKDTVARAVHVQPLRHLRTVEQAARPPATGRGRRTSRS